MIALALEHLCTRIEAAGLSWGTFALDGSSEPKRVSVGRWDADALKNSGLMVGIDFGFPVGEPTDRPLFSEPITRNVDVGAGTAEIEPALEWASRLINIHLYMRETRPEAQRQNYSVNSQYLVNEARLLAALGRGREDYTLTVDGIPRGFSTRYEGNPFVAEPGLTLHSVFGYRLTYPLVEGVEPLEVFLAKRIRLVHDLPPGTEMDLTAEPLTPPEPGRVTVVE